MNAKRILNNYRAGKMPRSVYRRGGSKGRKLPMNQFFQGDEQQLMNPGSGMGQGQTMLEQQTGPSQIEIANNVLAYANQLIEQGNYKDTRKGRQKAFEDAQIAHGLVTPKQKSNFLDYFNAVTGLLGPVATTYSTIKGAKNQSNNPSMSGGMPGGVLGRKYGGPSRKLPKNQFRVGDDIGSKESAVLLEGPEITKELIDKGGTMTPEMRAAFIKRMAMNERALQSILQQQAAQQALMNKDYLGPGAYPGSGAVIGVQPQSSGFIQDMINAAIQQGLQQGASPYMKRKGGAKKKTKYQNLGEKNRNLSPAEVAMLMQGLSGTVGGTTVLPETVVTPTFSPVSSKLLPMEQKLLEEVQTYQPRQIQMPIGQVQRLADMQNRYSGFGKSNLSESGIPRVYRKGGPYRDKAPMPGSNPLPEVPKRGLGGAQERVGQMKYGGSCRGLPGGPNEFPM